MNKKWVVVCRDGHSYELVAADKDMAVMDRESAGSIRVVDKYGRQYIFPFHNLIAFYDMGVADET